MNPIKFCKHFALLFVLILAACSNDPSWVDTEAHEKTMQLREQYTPVLTGTWHFEYMSEKQRCYEQLTFGADGSLSGQRKWLTRGVVTIDGKETFTDWEEIEDAPFTGTWQLQWKRSDDGKSGSDQLMLYAGFTDSNWMAYANDMLFIAADDEQLTVSGHLFGYIRDREKGQITFLRGESKPDF